MLQKKLPIILIILFFTLLPIASSDGTKIIDQLIEGNTRFVEGKRNFSNQDLARRTDLFKNGQKPMVTVLSCSDSRVPPEHIFDMGLGELFVIRVAGNVADTDEIGTIEYGTEHLHTPVLLVLGHSKCGAVTAVFKGDKVGGSIPSLVDNIIPAVDKIKAQAGAEFSDKSLDLAIEENVLQSIRDVLTKSEIVRELYEKGELQIAGGVYHLDTGLVSLLDTKQVLAVNYAKEGVANSIVPIVNIPWILFLMPVLSVFVYFIFFASGTKIKNLKVKLRLTLGFSLIGISFVLASIIDAGSLGIIARISSLGVILIFTILSSISISNHLGKIFHNQKERIIKLENQKDDDED